MTDRHEVALRYRIVSRHEGSTTRHGDYRWQWLASYMSGLRRYPIYAGDVSVEPVLKEEVGHDF